MSYLVLARKWRPQTFEEIIGQDHVTTTLRNAIRAGRIAHAYLFAGPRGVGKTTAARILAKAVNCEKGPTEHPCNQCSSCLEITASRSMDVSEIDGASNRGIDEIRDLRESVQYSPAQGRRRVYIIDEVHMLTKEAFNALLKTLEEPPAHAMFIFATTEAGKVPMTILSRCQRFDFRRIATADMVAHLRGMLQPEGIEADEESLFLVAQKAEGSLRDAISLLDQLISYGGRSISAGDVRSVLGLVDASLYFRAVELARSGDAAGALAMVDDLSSGGYELQEFVLGLLGHLRRLLYISCGAGEIALAAAPPEERSRYAQQSAGMDSRDLMRMIRLLAEAEASMRRSPQPRLILELAYARLCTMDATVRIEGLLSRLDGAGGGGGAGPAASAGKKPSIESTTPPGPPEAAGVTQGGQDMEALWSNLLAEVKGVNMILGTCLETARPVGVRDGNLVLGFSGPQASFSMAKMENKQLVCLVEEQAARLWGCRLRVVCQLEGADKEAPLKRASREDEVERRRQEAQSSPLISKFMKAVDGEVL
jgi:DNA polymerase-3 subunit gamma/tau